MQTIIFASNNQHKVEEVNSILNNRYHIVSLKEAGIEIEIPEPYETIHENASIKSFTIHKLTGQNCFSEDTGLEVEALNGEPGVKSARYGGEGKDFKQNVDLLLSNLYGCKNREARFRTVISLIFNDEEYFFQGLCLGRIEKEPRGKNGFGYDPVFTPDGSSKTFAEMSMQEKSIYSHRQKATNELFKFLSHNWKKSSQL